MKIAVVVAFALWIAASPAAAQVGIGGQTAVHFLKSAPTSSPLSVNNGRPSFGWQLYFFLDGRVTEHVTAMSNISVTDNEYLNFDLVAIRLTNLTPLGLNVEAGKVDVPFGNLGERRFPRRNPLFGLPLMYEYRTALPDHLTTEAEVLANQGQGRGMRLLDLGLYDLGGVLFGSWGIVDYAVAVTNGTISTTSYSGEVSNSDVAKVIRLAVTPMTGLTIGAAYTWGAYLEEPTSPPPGTVNVNSYKQKAAEIDVEFSRGHAVLYGQAVYNIWPVPFDTGNENLNVLGYYLEGKFTVIPRLYLALRFSGLQFGHATLGNSTGPWDYDVTEWEGGAGYFAERDVLIKLVRRETRIHGGSWPKDNLTVLQLTVAY